MSKSVLENEEDVKLSIVDWLTETTDLKTSISLEKNFTVRVGKSVYKFDSNEQIKAARGRYDVLVKCGDKNLLIAEIKHPDKDLTDDDRDQGISYARLLPQIAPYVLVTNGKEHRLFDTLTRDTIDPELVAMNNISLVLPDDLLAEAQEIFFRLNQSNLSQFCQSQCESTLALIVGSLDDNKKYVAELNIDRANVRTTLTKFIDSDKTSLTVLGDTGSGKTCVLAAVIHYLQSNSLNCFFFNGSRIESTLQNEISNTYDWTFSDSESTSKIVKRLTKIGKNTPIIVVVDGIDEITSGNIHKEIESLLSKTKGTCLKFIFSCKTSTFEQFAQISQLPTELVNTGDTYILEELNNTEFKQLIEKYDKAFGIKPNYSDEFSTVAKRNLFILRLMYQIAADGDVHELNLNSNDIIDKYIDQQLDKCANKIASATSLNLFARHTYNTGKGSFKLSELSVATPPIVCDTAFNDLIQNGLLSLEKRNSTSYSVSFNFEQIQSYVIAFNVLLLNEKTTDEIQVIIDEFQYGSIQDTVIQYYYTNIGPEHRDVFEDDLRTKADNYLQKYDRIVGKHLKAIDTRLEPTGSGKLGIVLQLYIKEKKTGGYGFRRAKKRDERVVFVPTNPNMRNTRHALYDQGVSVFTQGSCPLSKPITEKTVIADRNLYEQSLDLAFDGDLYEGASTAMLSEKMIALISDSTENFELVQDKLDQLEPVSFDEIHKLLKRKRLAHHYERDYIDRNIIPSQPVVDGVISFTFERTSEYREWLKSTVNKAMETGEHPEVIYTHTDLDKLTDDLTDTIKLLESINVDSIQLSNRYEKYAELKRNAIRSHELEELGALAAEIHNERRDNYKIISHSNFPTLIHYLVSNQHNDDIYITLEIHKICPHSKDQIGLSYYHVDSKKGRTIFVSNSAIELQEHDNYLIHKGIKHSVKTRGHTSLESFIESRGDLNGHRFGDGHMRRGVYSDIHRALTELGKDQFTDILSAN